MKYWKSAEYNVKTMITQWNVSLYNRALAEPLCEKLPA